MTLRRILLLSATLILLAGLVGAYYLYTHWMDPATVQRIVVAKLEETFPNAKVRIESAHVRIFGGIRVQNLSLSLPGDSVGNPEVKIAEFPEILIYLDKEKLRHGEIILSRVKLVRPRILVIINEDGSTNISKIMPVPDPDRRIPQIELEEGELTVLDGARSGNSWVFDRVHATAGEAEGAPLYFQISGSNQAFGEVEAKGSVKRVLGDLVVNIGLPSTTVDEHFLAIARPYAPEMVEAVSGSSGRMSVLADVSYHPGTPTPWCHDVRIHLTRGRISHPELPAPIEDAELSAHRIGDGPLIIDSLTGRVAEAQLHASGRLESASAEGDISANIKITDYTIGKEIYDKLPDRISKFCHDFQPTGPLNIECELNRRNGEIQLAYRADLKGISAEFKDFPYPVAQLRGSLIQRFDATLGCPAVDVNLRGVGGGRPVSIRGKVFGKGLELDDDTKTGLKLQVNATEVALTDRLANALIPKARKAYDVVQELQPTGIVDVDVNILRPQGQLKPDIYAKLKFRDAQIKYARFPYPLEQLEGQLWVEPGGVWRFDNAKARHKGAIITGRGSGRPGENPSDPPRFRLAINGTNVAMDEELRQALTDEEMQTAWQHFQPSGRADIVAIVEDELRGDNQIKLDLTLTARECRMKPDCFPYQLENVIGTFRYKDGTIHLSQFTGRHGPSTIQLSGGTVKLLPAGGYDVDLKKLRAANLTIDRELELALPPGLKGVLDTLGLNRPVSLKTDLTVNQLQKGSPPTYSWNGTVAISGSTLKCGVELSDVIGSLACQGSFDGSALRVLGNLNFERAVLFNQPIEGITSKLILSDDKSFLAGHLRGEPARSRAARAGQITEPLAPTVRESIPDTLVLPDLRGQLHGGEIHCPVRVELGPQKTYALNLRATNVDLHQFRATLPGTGDGQVRGKASMKLDLTGKGEDIRSLKGTGHVHIPRPARLYDLPLIVDLLKFLSGRLPDGTAFEQAQGEFQINGPEVHVSDIELLGSAITLRGEGYARIDGSALNLEMYGLFWGGVVSRLPPFVRLVPPMLSKPLMRIRLAGSFSEVKPRWEPLPILMDPIRRFQSEIKRADYRY